MTVHMIIGFTLGTDKIIEALRRRGETHIFVMDHMHEGPPLDVNGVPYISPTEYEAMQDKYPDMQIHFYQNRMKMMDIRKYKF